MNDTNEKKTKQKSTKNLLFIWIALIFLSLVYLPTFLFPYLLTDELWIIRGISLWSLFPMGRPLFSVFGWLSGIMNAKFGYEVIVFVLRGSAIIGLSCSVYFLMRWLERWGHDRRTSFGLALATMTLPAYQIVVADGTQLAYAILSAILATLTFHRAFETRSILLIASSYILFNIALSIYQQQALIFFALLAVPLLQDPSNRRIQFFVLSGGAFATIISLFYFIVWSLLSHFAWPNIVNTRYGPYAVSLPTFTQFIDHFSRRIPQVANLWHISPFYSWIVVGVALLMIVKMSCDIRSGRWTALLSYAILVCFFIASDSFALVAHAYTSYITSTAMSLLVFYWAFSGIILLLRRYKALASYCLAIIGGFLAFTTINNRIAIPNWQHFQEVRSVILANPDVENFHLLGIKASHKSAYQEFTWLNAQTDVYLSLLARTIVDDLVFKGEISPAQRNKMFFSVSNVLNQAAPESQPSEPRLNAMIISLSSTEN